MRVGDGDRVDDVRSSASIERLPFEEPTTSATSGGPTPWGLLEASPDATFVVDAQGRIAFANARAEAMFGYGPGELAGAPMESLLASRSRSHFGAQLATATGTPFDSLCLKHDGQELPVEIAMSTAHVAGEGMVIATLRDITARTATAAALRERERQLASIYDTVNDVLFELAVEDGNRFRFVSVNERFCSVTGLHAQQVVGKYVGEVIPEPSLTFVKEKYAEAIREKRTVRWEEVSDYPSGRLVGQVSAHAVFDADGACTRIVGTVHDLTAVASERMAAVGTLAAGVAHEINNPLAVVIANVERVSGEPLPEELRAGLREARDCAERIRTIVRDLKLFSRAEEASFGPVDTESVLESTLRMAANEIRHRARLVRQYGKVPPALANESRLEQAFLNLLVNAAHAIPVGKAELNEIRVSTRLGERQDVIVEIADTGCGMPPEVRQRLFTPFFTTKPVGVGTGLGLSICHRIVTSLGGTIEVESEPGRGSVFRIHLPLARSEAAPPRAPAGAAPAAGRRGRVLIVDDEPALAKTLLHLLSPAHEAIATTRAKDALERVAAGERFDVILCDLMMPDMTGMDLHEALLRSTPEQAERMIFMTGGAFTARASEFLDRVANQCLEKPFKPQELLEMVNARVR